MLSILERLCFHPEFVYDTILGIYYRECTECHIRQYTVIKPLFILWQITIPARRQICIFLNYILNFGETKEKLCIF